MSGAGGAAPPRGYSSFDREAASQSPSLLFIQGPAMIDHTGAAASAFAPDPDGHDIEAVCHDPE